MLHEIVDATTKFAAGSEDPSSGIQRVTRNVCELQSDA